MPGFTATRATSACSGRIRSACVSDHSFARAPHNGPCTDAVPVAVLIFVLLSVHVQEALCASAGTSMREQAELVHRMFGPFIQKRDNWPERVMPQTSPCCAAQAVAAAREGTSSLVRMLAT